MAARENGYCTSFILMLAQLDWEGIEGMSHFPRSISLKGGDWEGEMRGRGLGGSCFLGRLEDCGLSVPPGVTGATGAWGTFASRGYWGTFLVFFFLIWQCMKLATKEATTRTPENRQESMRREKSTTIPIEMRTKG